MTQVPPERDDPADVRARGDPQRVGKRRPKELNTMLSLILASVALLVLGGGISQNIMRVSVEGFSVPRELVFDASQLPYQFMYMASQARWPYRHLWRSCWLLCLLAR